jgi:hypothetical protein
MSLIAGGRRGAEIPAAENGFQWKREKSMFEVMLKRFEQPDEIRTVNRNTKMTRSEKPCYSGIISALVASRL